MGGGGFGVRGECVLRIKPVNECAVQVAGSDPATAILAVKLLRDGKRKAARRPLLNVNEIRLRTDSFSQAD